MRDEFQCNFRFKSVSPRKHTFLKLNFSEICVWKWKLSQFLIRLRYWYYKHKHIYITLIHWYTFVNDTLYRRTIVILGTRIFLYKVWYMGTVRGGQINCQINIYNFSYLIKLSTPFITDLLCWFWTIVTQTWQSTMARSWEQHRGALTRKRLPREQNAPPSLSHICIFEN